MTDVSDPVGRGAAETAATDIAGLTAAITKALLDASWEGRWNPLDETNVAPLVSITVPIVIDAVLAAVGSDTPTYEPARMTQALCGEWTDRNFLPADNLERRALVLTEEVGEVVRCVLKMEQGVRGTRDEWMAELRKELGDAQGALYALAHRAGIDLEEAAGERWQQLADRDYKADPQQHGLPSNNDRRVPSPHTDSSGT